MECTSPPQLGTAGFTVFCQSCNVYDMKVNGTIRLVLVAVSCVAARLTEELKNEASRVLFLLSTTSDPAVPGNSPTGPGDEAKAASQDESQQVRHHTLGTICDRCTRMSECRGCCFFVGGCVCGCVGKQVCG